MEASATLPKFSLLRTLYSFITPIIIIAAIALGNEAGAQTKVLATKVSDFSPNFTSLTGCGPLGLLPCNVTTVENPNNAILGDNSYARLVAGSGLAVGLGAYEGIIELQFDKTLPANSWSYVRVDGDADLFGSLLGGSLGSAIGKILDVVLLGSQEITVEAKRGDSLSVLTASSVNSFVTDNDNVRLVTNQDGDFLIAIRPDSDYDRIRITNATGGAVGLGVQKYLNIYNAFYYEDASGACGRPLFTSFDGGGGLGLDVLPIEEGTLGRAIDNDEDSYSVLKSNGLIGLDVAGSLSQNFYYPTLSNASATANIKLSLGTGSLLDLKVLSGVEVIFKSNGVEVATKNLNSGLLAGTDLLGLLQNGQPVTLTFGPGVPFNEIEVRSNALVGLDLGSADVRIYDVQRFDDAAGCANPNIQAPTATAPMLSHKFCATQLLGFEHANFPHNAVDGNNDTHTTLEAGSGLALGIGAYDGYVELGFTTPLTAGETAYVRIDFDEEALLGLLDGSLGQFAGDLVNNVLFGGHYFTIEGKNEGTTVLSRTSRNGFSNVGQTGNGVVRIVQDKNGHYYVAITPETTISSIRITESVSSLLGLGTVKTMNVYHACYATGSDECEQGFATWSESSGISLDALGLGGAGVLNAQNALDGDINTASQVSVGAVGVGSTMMQHVQFHGLSALTDHFRVKLKMQNNGVVSAELLGSIMVEAYNGDTKVYSQRLNEQLIPGVDLLNLLSNGQMVSVAFSPGTEFDRVAVGISSLVAANVIAAPLEIYSVERFSENCPDPELQWDPKTTSPFNTPGCAGEVVSFENVNFPHQAVLDNPNADTYATLSAGAGVAAGLGAYSSHIELKYDTDINAHEVSYIRVDAEGNLFDALLGGSLGDALGTVLGTVALGNQYIVIQAKDAAGNNVGLPQSSMGGLNSQYLRLVKDKDGRYYLAVTAPGPYRSVRIEYHHTAVVGAMGSSSLNVYGMCRETEFDLCEQATFTSWDGSGIALDIADLTNGGVANPEFAIDDNNSNYSTLNLGAAGVAASVSQIVYFTSKSNAEDELRVRLQLAQPGILNVDLFGNSKLIFYDGEQNVKEMTLESGLINNLDLLGLFNSGGAQTFTFAPGVVYDRVELKISSVVAVGTSAPIRLYGMSRLSADCPDPDFLPSNEVFRSPVCADEVVMDAIKAVDDVDFAIDGDYNSYATMRADAGVIFGLGNQPSELELKFSSPVAANTTSYLRIDDDAGLLESLLSGSLGEVVYGIINNVALGDNYFVVRAKNGANTVLEGNSRDGFAAANGLMKIVQDKAGRYYVAISPDVEYTSVEIKAFSESIVGITAEGYNLHVYGMCYETNFDGCSEAFTTSWDGSGLAVGITGIGEYGVVDAFKALDNNNNSDYSTLSLGTLNVAGHIQQNIQFNKELAPHSIVKVRMSVGEGQIDASVFGNMRLVAYNNGADVYNETIENAVIGNVNLAQLFDNGAEGEISFSPGVAFDEVALRLDALVGASVAVPNVRLYYIVEDCTEPEFVGWKSFEINNDPTTTSVSGGETVEYTIHIRNTGTVPVNGFVITDEIPAHTTLVDGSITGGGEVAGGIITWSGIDVPVDGETAVSFAVTVNENLNGVSQISNVAYVKANENDPGMPTFPPSETDPNEPDDTGDTGTDIPVVPTDDIVAWKGYTIDGDPAVTSVSGGEEITYTIYIRNESNQNLTDLSVSDAIPAGTTFVSASNGGEPQGATVEFAGIDIDFGQTASVSFVVRVNDNLTDISAVSNVAFVKKDATDPDPGQGTVPPADPTNPSNGPDPGATPGTPTDVPVDAIHSIELGLVGVSGGANSGQAAPGDVITYTVTVTNDGNQDLTDVLLADAVPANTTLQDAGDFTLNGTDLQFTIPALEVGQTETYTFTVTVDPIDPTSVTSIDNSVTASNTEVNETATHSMPTACVEVDAGSLTLTATLTEICLGEEITFTADLSASAPAGLSSEMVKWYAVFDEATGVVSEYVGDGSSVTFTPTQAGELTYYAIIVDPGFCFDNPPAEITVTVNAVPATPGISASATTVCEGEGLTLTATAGADTYRWFKDGVEILGEAANALTISATELADAGEYTVVAVNTTACESAPSTGITVTVTPRAIADDIEVTGDEDSVCEGTAVTLEATSSVTNPIFRWYGDAALTDLLFTGETLTFTPLESTTFYVTVGGDGVCENEPGSAKVVNVTVNPTPAFTVDGPLSHSIEVGNSVGLPTIQAPTATVTWYDNNGNVHTDPTATDVFDTPGTYTYTAVITETDHCTVTVSVIINVFAEGECPPVYDRIYATDASEFGVSNLFGAPLGGVNNQSHAADNDINSFSELTEGVNALGLFGQTYQTLKWLAPVAAGTPVSVKLGKQFSTLNVLGTLRIVAVDASGNAVGVSQSVEPNILNALGGINVYDYTFTPTNASGEPVAYSGVKIYYQGALSLSQAARIYEAYYHQVGAVECGDDEVLDVLHGVENPITGLGVGNALIGVTNPENVFDGAEDTYAVMNNVAGVNAQTRLEVRYNTPALAGDEVRILLSEPGGLLEVEALTSFTIQPYLGDAPVGEPISHSSNLLRIELLGGGNQAEAIYSADRPFDRIKILYGGVANVLGQLNVHEITRDVPQLELGDNGDNIFEICEGEDIVIDPDDCTTYLIYDLETDGAVVDITELAPGTHTLYVQTVRFGTCEVGTRTEITVTVHALPVVNSIKLNGAVRTNHEIALAPHGELLVELDVTGTGLTYAWEINTDGEWADYDDADGASFTYGVPLVAVGTEVRFRATIASAEGCAIVTDEIVLTITAQEVDYDLSNLAVTKDNAVADGVDYNEFTATIVDAFGMPISGVEVVFNITNPDGTTGTQTVTTGVDGTAVIQPTSTTAGMVTVEALVDGTEINNSPATATFVAGPVDYDKSNLAVTKDNAVADGVDYNEFTATIVDAFDNPIAGVDVVFNITNPDGTTDTQTVTTGVDGTAVIQPTSTTAGDVTVAALVDGTEINNSPATATFVAGPVDYDLSNLAVTKDNAVADGVDYNEFTATIVDAFDNPISGVDVVFNITNPDGTTGTQTVTTGVDGTAVIQPTSTTAGDVTVAALVDGTEINNSPATATFVAGPVDYDKSNLAVTKDNAVADGVDYNEFTATIVDAFDNPISGVDVVFNIANPDGTNGTQTVTTGVDGTAVIQPTSTTAGDVTVAALVDGTEINNSPATATFVAGPVDYGKSNLAVTKDNAVADGVDYNEFTATIVDAFDNPIAGVDVVFNIANPDGTNGTQTVTTGVDGTAVIQPTSTTAGDVTVAALVDGTEINNSPATATFVAANNMSVVKTAQDDHVIAGAETQFTLTLTNDGPTELEAGKEIYLVERPSQGLTITGYAVDGTNATVVGTGNTATVTTASVIPVGGTITVVVTADVDANAGETITNGISVWGPDKDPEEDPEDDRDDTPEIPVVRESLLSISKTANDASVVAGGSTSFTLTITNEGPSAIGSGEAISLAERPGAGVTITGYAVDGTNATVAGTGNTATVTTASVIPVGGTITVVVTADVDANAGETITNGISVWGPDKDPEEDPEDDRDDTPEIPVVRESLLSISKTANDASVVAGGSTSFTLTITNEGPSAIGSGEAISLAERPGAGVTITGYAVDGTNATVAGTGNTATVTTASVIPVGGTITVVVTADVDANAGETITNGISVWGPDKDPEEDPEDDRDDTPEIPVVRESLLSISKTANDASVVAGGSTSFTLTITNEGPSAIGSGEAISLAERPGAGVTITGYAVDGTNATVAGTGNTATVTTASVIPVGGAITVVVTADVDANAGETITNGISVWGPDKDPEDDPEDDRDDTPEIPVVRESLLSISKTANDASVVAGGSTSFTLTITNEGPSAIGSGEAISLAERPGAGVTITGYAVDGTNATVAGTGNTATVTTASVIPVGGTITVVVTADVDANAGETITNGISVWGPDKNPDTEGPDDEDDTPEIPVVRVAELTIDKVADETRVQAGESTTFTLTITNTGPSILASGEVIALTERPGAGVTITGYEIASGGATIEGAGNAATVTSTEALGLGESIVVRVTANVAADAPATITNGVDVYGPGKNPGTDEPDDKDDTPEVPVDHNFALSITKVADEARVRAGESTSFTLTITNGGPATIPVGRTISLVERPGNGLSITGYEVTSGNGRAEGAANRATVTTSEPVAAGDVITVRVDALVSPDARGTVTNGISVWGPGKDVEGEEPDDEDDTPAIPVDREFGLTVDKVADDASVVAGGTTSFTVTVTNNGPATIAVGELIQLEERPAEGLAITDYEVLSGNATASATDHRVVLTTTESIAAGGTLRIAVHAEVTASAGEAISNGIAVWGPGKNPDTDDEDDESKTPEIPVTSPYTLSIEKVADQALVTAGQPTTFTVTITNNGPMAIAEGADIALEERPGAGVTVTRYEVLDGLAQVVGAGNQATIRTTGIFAPSTSIVLQITADVATTATGTITNGIAVWGPDKEPGDEPDDEDEITPVPIDAVLVVPNLFTPNGDGINDQFVVRNLMQYQHRELTVLNRWGNQVYRSNNYNNDWDGGSLGEGTYFYILRVRNSSGEDWQVHKGAVAVIRNTNR